MLIYLYTFFISIFFASLIGEVRKNFKDVITFKKYYINKKHVEYALLFLSMCPFILLSGLRYSVGCDYFTTYVPIFQNVASGMSFADVGTEPAFFLLNKIISLLGGGTVWLFLITSTIIISLLWISFYKNSDNIVLSITLFFCAESFFISIAYVRQFISIAIAFYCFRYIKEQSLIKYIIGIIIAGLFHTSAFMFLPLYFAQFIRLNPFIISGLILLFSVFNSYIINFMTFIIEKTPYSRYFDGVYQSPHRMYTTKLLTYLLIFIIASCFYKNHKENRFYIFMLNINALVVFLAANFNILPQIDRLMFSFDVVIFLLVPFILNKIENKWIKNVLTFAIIAACSLVTYDNIVNGLAHGVLPYRFVFNPSLVIK